MIMPVAVLTRLAQDMLRVVPRWRLDDLIKRPD